MPKRTIIEKKEGKVSKKTLVTDVMDQMGKVVGSITLSREVFGLDVHPSLMAQVVRVYLANQRLGTRQTKTRGDVVGSTKKVYRQKGTGRARHGSIKAPIYVGGGVAHGPLPVDFSLSLSKPMKKKALFGALSQKFSEKKLVVVRGIEEIKPKTKELVSILKNIQNSQKKMKTLLVMPSEIKDVFLAGRNIEGLSISPVKQIHAYQILEHKNIIFMEKAVHLVGKAQDEVKSPEKISSSKKLPIRVKRSVKNISSKRKKRV